MTDHQSTKKNLWQFPQPVDSVNTETLCFAKEVMIHIYMINGDKFTMDLHISG